MLTCNFMRVILAVFPVFGNATNITVNTIKDSIYVSENFDL